MNVVTYRTGGYDPRQPDGNTDETRTEPDPPPTRDRSIELATILVEKGVITAGDLDRVKDVEDARTPVEPPTRTG